MIQSRNRFLGGGGALINRRFVVLNQFFGIVFETSLEIIFEISY
jgi:hypothetical protein